MYMYLYIYMYTYMYIHIYTIPIFPSYAIVTGWHSAPSGARPRVLEQHHTGRQHIGEKSGVSSEGSACTLYVEYVSALYLRTEIQRERERAETSIFFSN